MNNRLPVIVLLAAILGHQIVYGQEPGTFTDERDGNVYKTVQIGEQTWMAENLKFWVPEDSPHYVGRSRFYRGMNENAVRYGRLYQWETARKACPNGWHLPTMDEWLSLLNHYGQAFSGGHENQTLRGLRAKMKLPKEERKARKKIAKEAFINFTEGGESGFDVLFGGYFELNGPGPDSGLGTIARFWSSEDNVTKGLFKNLKAEGVDFHKWGKVIQPLAFLKDVYASVRCVKDSSDNEEAENGSLNP